MRKKGSSNHNVVVAVNTGRPGTSTHVSSRQHVVQRSGRTTTTHQEESVSENTLTPEELEQQEGEALPDREAMSLINANVAAPVNAAVALNALSDDSTAIANAEQTANIDQSN
ncbi:MAG: hypothetical protein KY454_05505 [Actinobacteria bacterium]|nr:hypothetical protein [Actinomycetota bacterium]MBW3650824.1 hypothetical protein [Actinomycetota bacterium]